MVVKVYISGISGNKEVKKRQQRVLMILDSKTIKYEVIDITEPGKEGDKDFMQNNAKCNGGTVSDPNPRSPLPPQVFSGEEYCGDYDQFDLANEVDTLEQFLKLESPSEALQDNEISIVNGSVGKVYNNANVDASGDIENNGVNEKGPTDDETEAADHNNPLEEPSLKLEDSDERLKPEGEIEALQDEKISSKESSPVNVDNGVVSSNEESNEQENIEIKENPSEALIESEKAVSAE